MRGGWRWTSLDTELPPEVLDRVRRRLGHVAAVVSALLFLVNFFTWAGYLGFGRAGTLELAFGGDLISLALAVTMWRVARSERIGAMPALRTGLVVEVLLCTSLSMITIHNDIVELGRVPKLTWATMVIAVFPLIVPVHARTTVWVSALSALPTPAAVMLWGGQLYPDTARLAAEAFAAWLPQAVAVGVAVAGSRVIYDAYVHADELVQQERLLHTVLDSVNTALLLVDQDEKLRFYNGAAASLMHENVAGRASILGHPLDDVLNAHARKLLSVTSKSDGMLIAEAENEPEETYHVTRHPVELQYRAHTLWIIRPVTREVRARETAAYRRVIRIFSHEMNSSLSPVKSVLHSARKLLHGSEHRARLDSAFEVVTARIEHLQRFLAGYMRLVRLPQPRRAPVDWAEFLEHLRTLHVFRLTSQPPPEPAMFDAGQIQQVLINLFNNALEADSPPQAICLDIQRETGRWRLSVHDGGHGMSREVREQALVPLFSTRPQGSGLGLSLCREIVEAHGGSMTLTSRAPTGTTVSFTLPIEPVDELHPHDRGQLLAARPPGGTGPEPSAK